MQFCPDIREILERADRGQAPSRHECEMLLAVSSDSLEAALVRTTADQVSRRRFDHAGYISGQIGAEVAPCSANCAFCAFAADFTTVTAHELTDAEILERAKAFVMGGDLHTLYIMTMHRFEFDRLVNVVAQLRSVCPAFTEIVVNIGDFDTVQARELKAAGVGAAYHVCRLREGVDTNLDPEKRRQTLGIIRDAGLRLHTCCEPIGPEHTVAELVEQIFIGIEYECYTHAAMRRVPIPGSPLYHYGQISELRLAQVVAVVALATLEVAGMGGIGVHEPNVLALTSGANSICAETGPNPRDTAAETSGHRGRSVEDCRQLLREAGFNTVNGADGSLVDIMLEKTET